MIRTVPLRQPLRRAAHATSRAARGLQVELRGSLSRWPDFIIVGAAKAGTSALYRHLCQQPGVLPSARKEVHYFNLNFTRRDAWYRSHFPLRMSQRSGAGTVTGEATPYYMFHPLVPGRVAARLPDVRLSLCCAAQ